MSNNPSDYENEKHKAVEQRTKITEYRTSTSETHSACNSRPYDQRNQEEISQTKSSHSESRLQTNNSYPTNFAGTTPHKSNLRIVPIVVIIITIIMLLLLIIISNSRNSHNNPPSTVEEITTESSNTTMQSTSSKNESTTQYLCDNLKDIVASESDGYYTDDSAAMDSVGNNYNNNFTTLGTTGVLGNGTSYASFYLGGRYKYLTGKLAVNNSSWNDHTASFSIYCDDNEIFNTGEVSKQFAPTKVSIDIENCQWLKIVVNNFADSGGEYINFILSDFIMYENAESIPQLSTEEDVTIGDVYLKSMTASESDGYYTDEGTAMDSVGNNYSNNFTTLGTTGVLGNGTSYATFYLGGHYSYLTGKLAVNNSSWNEHTASFSIYCDDNEVYNTGEVSKQFAPIDISVNIEKCQWLKIMVNNFADSGGEYINYILSDFCFRSSNNTSLNYKEEKSTKVEDTYLKNMTASESDDYYTSINSAKDSHGNAFDNHVVTIGAVGVLENGTSYATFFLGGNYQTLTGKIAINNSSWDDRKASFSIFCDDHEVYCTGDVGKEFNPSEISINVEKCEWLKIYVDNNDGEWGENINFILSEFKLHS